MSRREEERKRLTLPKIPATASHPPHMYEPRMLVIVVQKLFLPQRHILFFFFFFFVRMEEGERVVVWLWTAG